MANVDPITGLPVTQQANASNAAFTPTAPAVKSDVTTRGIDPATQTVQGQMANMTDANSPFYQKWATAGKETAAANGFTNGSMQQSGILNSVMQNGIPIATADASNANAVSNLNTVNQNNSNTALASAANQGILQNAQQANSLASTNAQLATTASSTNANNSTSLANTAANNLTSTNNSTNNITGALTQTAAQQVNAINMDKDMTPTAKQAAIAQIQSTIGAGSNVVSSIAKVGAMLNFNSSNGVSAPGAPGAPPPQAAAPTAAQTNANNPATLNFGSPGLPTSNLSNGMVVNVNGSNYQLSRYSGPTYMRDVAGSLANFGFGISFGPKGFWTKI